MLGAGTTPTSDVERLVEPLSSRLKFDALWANAVVAPLPTLLSCALELTASDQHARSDPALQHAALNLLATAMRRPTALFACRRHGELLTQLAASDMMLLSSLARRHPAPLLLQLELRCETLRNRAPMPRRIGIVGNAAETVESDIAWPLSREHTATLERLELVEWVDRTIIPAEDPDFIRARYQARIGTVTLRQGFRLWLAGKHLGPVGMEKGQTPASRSLGGIELFYRTIGLTAAGRDFARAVCDVPRSADRGWQAVEQRAFQQLQALR